MIKTLIVLLNLLIPEGRVVALTFDDGLGTWHSKRVMRIMDNHKARGTFFPRGRSLFFKKRNWDELVHLARNHEIGVHGWEQGDPRKWDAERTRKEFFQPIEIVKRYLHRVPVFYRAPSGIRLSAKQWGYLGTGRYMPIEVTWTYDTRDIDCYNARSKDCHAAVRERMRQLATWHGDYVVLMHDNLPDTPEHVQWLLERTQEVNYVTLTRFYLIKILKSFRRIIWNLEEYCLLS